MRLRLVQPAPEFRESFLKSLREFQAEGLPWHVSYEYEKIAGEFNEHVKYLLSKKTLSTELLVPETELWGIVESQVAGRISIRHELTDALGIVGGHIGYDTAPPFRKRGVVSAMLEQALPIAKSLGLHEVLLTCDDTNIGSIKVIEKNGGVLRYKRELAPDKPLKRYYWINLT